MEKIFQETFLGEYEAPVKQVLAELKRERIVERIWEHDYTVWKPQPEEIANRLGWLESPEVMQPVVKEIEGWVEEVRKAGFTHALLLGMGGSSLAPEVFRKTFGVKAGYLDLAVLDSTDPAMVRYYADRFDPARTLYIVSTKSGSTVETLSFMKYFYRQAVEALGEKTAGQHFVAITDPGSGLEALAERLKFRRVFRNDPNIGGRYSALSYFGLVPAALVGIDLAELLKRAAEMRCRCGGCSSLQEEENPAAWLGVVLGELALRGRDKLTLVLSPPVSAFGAWVEQLVAESTGKEGKGILPVVGEELLAPENYRNDRLFVHLKTEDAPEVERKLAVLQHAGHPVLTLGLRDLYDLGSQYFLWELTTAIASWRLNINPFDQPNVEASKKLAREMVQAYQQEGHLPTVNPLLEEEGIQVFGDTSANNLEDALYSFLAPLEDEASLPQPYVALQAYLPYSAELDRALQKFRTAIQKRYRVATTVGYGPRFLHSTGQLYKGDAGRGLFIQLSAEIPEDVPIPDRSDASITFGVLKTAQMLGDRQALQTAGRRVIAFHFRQEAIEAIQKLAGLLF